MNKNEKTMNRLKKDIYFEKKNTKVVNFVIYVEILCFMQRDWCTTFAKIVLFISFILLHKATIISRQKKW